MTETFVGRQWLTPLVADWLAGTQRFMLIVGAPGIGKTAISAWLTGEGQLPEDSEPDKALLKIRQTWTARHFCGRAAWRGGTDPIVFTNRISAQLARSSPRFAEAALRRLPNVLDVRVKAGQNYGDLIGVRINNLWVSGTSVGDGFRLGVIEPLEMLAMSSDAFRAAIVVDALDETISSGGQSIATLVASLSSSSADFKVLATTKPDRRIRDLFPPADTIVVDMMSPEYNRAGRLDLESYVFYRFSVNNGDITPAQKLREWSAEEVIEAADGNFQFARYLIDEIEDGMRDHNAGGLPDDLSGLYLEHLSRLLPSMADYGSSESWLRRYLPIMGLLAVAREPIPLTVAVRLLGWPESTLTARIDDLQQMVRVDEYGRLALFHGSMAEFLGTRRVADAPNPYYVAPLEQHEHVVRRYLELLNAQWSGDWSRCDDYGLDNLIWHVLQCVESGSEQVTADALYALASDPRLLAAQRHRFPASQSVTRAADAAFEYALEHDHHERIGQMLDALVGTEDPALAWFSGGAYARWYRVRRAEAGDALASMLASPSSATRQVALLALHEINFRASPLHRVLALSESADDLAAAAFLALQKWSAGAREEVMNFMAELAQEINPRHPNGSRRRIHYLVETSVMLYTNNLRDTALIDWGDDLWHDILTHQLHLNRFDTRVFRELAARIAGRALSRGIAQTAFPTGGAGVSERNRAQLRIVSRLLDLDVDLRPETDALASVLDSDLMIVRALGAVVVAAHYYRHGPPLQADLHPRISARSARARLWHLLALTLTDPLPHDWSSFVRDETVSLIEQEPDLFLTLDRGALNDFNVLLLPLGLTATSDDAVAQALSRWLRTPTGPLPERLVEALGVLGLYRPAMAIAALRQLPPVVWSQPTAALLAALAHITTLHPGSTQLLLDEMGLPHLHAAVMAMINTRRSRDVVSRIGYFNNAVDQMTRHPVMRDSLLQPGIRLLAESQDTKAFVRRYSKVVMRLLKEHNYHPVRWMGDRGA